MTTQPATSRRRSRPGSVGAISPALTVAVLVCTAGSCRGDPPRFPDVEPPQAGPETQLSGVELGRYLYQSATCPRCHGPDGEGGIENPNSAAGTHPALDDTASQLGLDRPDRAGTAAALLSEPGALLRAATDPPFETFGTFVDGVVRLRTVIRDGSQPEPRDPTGPAPTPMPPWGAQLDEREIDAIIAYLISLGSSQ